MNRRIQRYLGITKYLIGSFAHWIPWSEALATAPSDDPWTNYSIKYCTGQRMMMQNCNARLENRE